MAELPDFDSLLDLYARYRTGYSPALLARVLALARPAPRVLDLGAGTGLAARDLAPRASRLVAADVARAMLARCPVGERALARGEALPFRAASFDLVTCAQAFHWLDPAPAFAEAWRVLTPGGAFAMWWKYEDPDDPSGIAADRAFTEVTGKPAPTTMLETEAIPGVAESPFREAREEQIPWEMRTTVEAYVGYHASRENLRRAAGAQRDAVLARMRDALAKMHPSGEMTIPYRQRLVWLRKPA